ncbi:uncharacterized protein LOC114557745 isoform X4 [Perca flavescens]|uniref:uncharacterized protein LOC114557745 isoform X4 n=1 Tax=Perca flavescens TaxID=8167 RepID=UPI00106F0153|nr:uncharacterized protein LOC114557745 isoform X4 [Perca flavescens]
MSVKDICRLCNENLRIKGTISGSRFIFQTKDPREKSISERLTELGLPLSENVSRSSRICMRCFRLLGRLENELDVFRRWQEAEKETSPAASTVTYRFTPMSMTCPQPPTTTAPPAPKYSRPTTENVIPKTARPSLTEFNLGFSKRLLLKDRAVPTLSGQPGDSEPQPGIRAEEGSILIVRDPSMKSEPDDIVISDTALLTPPATKEYVKAECASELGLNEGGSIQTVQDPSVKPKPGTADSSCGILPPVRHVASQTDPPKIKSVGTQLSMQTLQNPFRSKATQVKMPSRDCGVWTDTFPLDSPLLLLQPTLVKRPSKRPRLSLTDEEEGPSEPS